MSARRGEELWEGERVFAEERRGDGVRLGCGVPVVGLWSASRWAGSMWSVTGCIEEEVWSARGGAWSASGEGGEACGVPVVRVGMRVECQLWGWGGVWSASGEGGWGGVWNASSGVGPGDGIGGPSSRPGLESCTYRKRKNNSYWRYACPSRIPIPKRCCSITRYTHLLMRAMRMRNIQVLVQYNILLGKGCRGCSCQTKEEEYAAVVSELNTIMAPQIAILFSSNCRHRSQSRKFNKKNLRNHIISGAKVPVF
ncbi:hypothetical protein SK128_001415 [Halocaridina rubra]|uniref:Uncharacterized protein n=1 Tax=Halocaridina rubra TaxID=373956 RepID=A0AAN8XT74_HALRR